jgi:hypothetical protein
MLISRRELAFLDRTSHGSLFTAKPVVYFDTALNAAFFQPVQADTAEHRLDSFLTALYASPDNPDLPTIESFGRVARYTSRHPYITSAKLARRLTFDLPEYMLINDIIKLDILQKNLFTHHIYFTDPSAYPIFAPWCKKITAGLWEFIPK